MLKNSKSIFNFRFTQAYENSGVARHNLKILKIHSHGDNQNFILRKLQTCLGFCGHTKMGRTFNRIGEFGVYRNNKFIYSERGPIDKQMYVAIL
jgi:hypothetical protein